MLLGLGAFVALVVAAGLLLVAHWRASSARLLADATIRVVDGAGAPVAGVTVDVLWYSLEGAGPYLHHQWIGPSHDDGFVPTTRLAGSWAIDASFDVAPDMLGHEAAPVRLSAQTVLVVPPSGSVVLQLVDDHGAPFQYADLPTQFASLRTSGNDQTVRWSPRGRAEFAPVACGTELQLIARVQGWSLGFPRGGSENIRGPQRSGEVMELIRTVPDATPRLVGVVRNADGSPASGPLGLSLQCGGSSFSAFTVTPDGAGKFSFLLHERLDRSGPWKLQLHRADGKEVACEPQPPPDGWIDVGELRFDR